MTTTTRPEVSPPAESLSGDLHDLARRFEQGTARLADLLATVHGRGYHVILLLLALPFVSPLPLPGVSIPFGVAVAGIGFRLALFKEPWLPQRLMQYELPPRFVSSLLRGLGRVARLLEAIARPRWSPLFRRPGFRSVSSALIGTSGLFLILPIPLPFSNSLPAWTVILFSVGAIAQDGLLFLGGCLSFALSVAYFALVGFGGQQLLVRWVAG